MYFVGHALITCQDAAGAWHYLRDGEPVVGWLQDPATGDWYFFLEDGTMATGWRLVGGAWYFFCQEHRGRFGAMESGWLWDAGFWYYLSESHDGSFGAMRVGWQLVGGYWYYLYPQHGAPQGACALDTVTPDGYRVDASGRWVP